MAASIGMSLEGGNRPQATTLQAPCDVVRRLIPAAAVALTICALGCQPTKQDQDSRPNVLLITIDSLRADRVGYAGYAPAATPRIDELAARAIRFREAQTPVPITAPALASLHTGRYPAHHGLRLEERHSLPESEVTIAETLSQAGYRTGAVAGSFLLHPKHGLGQGFADYWEAFAEVARPREVPVIGVGAQRVVERALEWLETAHRERFFLWVNFHDPHYFYSPPAPFDREHADRPYDGEVAYVDRELGRLLQRLKDYNVDERTMIVLAGTQGEGLMDHGEAYHGTLLYQSTLHVPLLVKPAGPAIEGGRDVPVPVSLVDVMPTILEVAGVRPATSTDGISLASALRPGGVAEADPERLLLSETMQPAALLGWRPMAAARSGRWKYIASGGSGRLLDLQDDPGETMDLAAARPEIAASMASSLSSIIRFEHPECAACGDLVRSMGLVWPAQVGPAGRPVDADARIDVANQALKAHRTVQRKLKEAAILLHKEVLSSDPDNRVALIEVGWLTGLGQPSEKIGPARQLLEKAQRLYADEGEIYHLLGHMAMLEPGGRQRAATLFMIGALLDPLNEEALYDAACGEALAGRKEEALDLLRRSIEAGFRDFPLMRRDKELDSIREDKRFAELVPPLPARPAAGTTPATPAARGKAGA